MGGWEVERRALGTVGMEAAEDRNEGMVVWNVKRRDGRARAWARRTERRGDERWLVGMGGWENRHDAVARVDAEAGVR